MLKFIKEKKFVFHFKFLLGISLIFFAVISAGLYGRLLRSSYYQMEMDARKMDLQNRAIMLADKLYRTSYLSSDEPLKETEVEIENLASFYNGRILIIDSSFVIIKDTFNIVSGNISMAQEIIQSFKGEMTNRYDKMSNHIIQTVPIYNEVREIAGIMLITASTQDLVSLEENVDNRAWMSGITFGSILMIVTSIYVYFLMKPYERLRDLVSKIAEGNLSYQLPPSRYEIVNQISDNLNRSLTKLRDMNQSREEFVANVSHELKTPITSIRVLADSLMNMEEVPNELYAEFMNDISDEIDREAKIIDDLLSLVKLDRTGIELDKEKININMLIQQILKRLRRIAAGRNIEMNFKSMREVEADIDETKFSLAINNLIENAIKYNKEGGFVNVELDADHKFCYIKVEDSGVGIPDEFKELIFDRFYRIDKARSRETGGTGLGLAIAKNIILKHDGIIKVSSKEGEGSIFTVRIPLNGNKGRDKA